MTNSFQKRKSFGGTTRIGRYSEVQRNNLRLISPQDDLRFFGIACDIDLVLIEAPAHLAL